VAASSQSWMLDTVSFHHDFQDRLLGADGLVSLRDRAVQLWDGSDPIVQSYLVCLEVSSPEDWYRACEDTYLVDWYRVLMAPWLTPTRSIQAPDILRRGLPHLGWHATESCSPWPSVISTPPHLIACSSASVGATKVGSTSLTSLAHSIGCGDLIRISSVVMPIWFPLLKTPLRCSSQRPPSPIMSS